MAGLDERLAAAAELARPGLAVADVGCDHGKLTAALAMSGRYRFCVENVGYVEFALFENGRFYDVLIGKGQGVF